MIKALPAIFFISLFIPQVLFGEPPALAPEFELQDTRQDVIKLKTYRDKRPVLLFFWASWSPMCQKELRILNDRYAGLVEDGVEVLAINVGERPESVIDFIRAYYLSYRVLLDKDASVAGSFDAVSFPTYALIDQAGYIIAKDDYFPFAVYNELISTTKGH